MKGLFCTTAVLDERSGGGRVSIHELNSLKTFCDEVSVYDRTSIPEEQWTDVFKPDKIIADSINEKFDLVHFNGNPWREVVKKVRGLNSKAKIVSSVPAHDLELSIEEHKRYGMDYEQYYPHMIHQWDEYTEHVRQSDLIIYPSNYSKNYLTRRMGLTNKTAVIPHGCTPPDSISFPAGDEFNAAYIGAWGPDKGVKYLVEAWSKLDYKDSTLFFFGGPSRDMGGYLSSIARGGRYHLYGWFYDFNEIVNKFSVAVFPSVTEGFNIGALECMSYGRTPIVSRNAGVSELIEDGYNGLLVDAMDVEQIMDKVSWCKENMKNVRGLGIVGHDKSEKHTWDKIENRYIEAYRSLCNVKL